MYLTPVKRITIPVYGSVDTSLVQGIIDTSAFQLTFRKKQLGFSEFVFPGAKHTRGEHMIGATAQCMQYTQPLVLKKMLTPEEGRACEVSAIVHDVGHGPYSHVLENILKTYESSFSSHNDRTISLILNELSSEIEKAGCNPREIADIVSKKNPLCQLISHKTVGADKISYIRVDQHHCGFPPTALSIGDLPQNLMYLHGVLGVDERMVPRIQEMQRYYFSMYSEVYMRKQTRALERLFERAVQLSFINGWLHPDPIWNMTDEQLIGTLSNQRGIWSNSINRLFYSERNILKAAVVLRMPNDVGKEIIRAKSIATLPLPESSDFFKHYADPRNVLSAEKAIASILKANLEDVVFTPVDDPHRLVPQDVQIYSPQGEPQGMLFEKFPNHQKACQELANSVIACRVMVAPELRERAASAAQEIYAILKEKSQEVHPQIIK